MTKARTASQKRRAKRSRKITLPGGESVAQPRKGLPRLHGEKPESSPPPIFQARIRQGVECPHDELNESDIGKCILALTAGDDRDLCRNTWGAISAARANYKARIIGTTGNPQCSTANVVHEEIQTDPNIRVDLRSSDQKDADARDSWLSFKSCISALPTPWHMWAIRGALDGFLGNGTLWTKGKPTQQGKLAVSALIQIGKMRQ